MSHCEVYQKVTADEVGMCWDARVTCCYFKIESLETIVKCWFICSAFAICIAYG